MIGLKYIAGSVGGGGVFIFTSQIFLNNMKILQSSFQFKSIYIFLKKEKIRMYMKYFNINFFNDTLLYLDIYYLTLHLPCDIS